MRIRHASFPGLLAILALPAMAAAPAAPAASASAPAASAPAAPGAATTAASATGKWVGSVDAGGTPIELTFNLKAEGEKLTGTLDVMGNATPISDGKVKGEDVTFKLGFDTGQGGPPLEISYVCKLKGDMLNIRSSFSMGEGAPPNVTEFVAKRAK